MNAASNILVVITPARNEAQSLPELYARLAAVLDKMQQVWRWLLVDDSSGDETFAVMKAISLKDARVGAIRLASPSGSHIAILAGLRIAARDKSNARVAIMASDLQDPPETLPALMSALDRDVDVVWAARRGRGDVAWARQVAGNAVHAAIRLVLWRSSYPASGADMIAINRPVMERVVEDRRAVGNIFVRIARYRFSSAVVFVSKERRRYGDSQWSKRALLRFTFASIGEAIGRADDELTTAPPERAAGWPSLLLTGDQGL